MSERLSAADVSFFSLEGRTTPQHVGGIAVFQPDSRAQADGFDYDRLVRLLDERISLVPRYRQKLRTVPGNLASPVWVDDPNFDITYHVRRSGLPRPGTDTQLLEFCARIQSRLLDRSRPLWEMYLIEGLAGGRVAVYTKTHHSMVDGVHAVDIAQVLLDAAPEPRRTVAPLWMPGAEPSRLGLAAEAIGGLLRRPSVLAETLRLDARSTRGRLGALGAGVGAAAATAAVSALRRPAPSPLRADLGEQRRLAIARTRLSDYRQVRRVHGGTVNDVMLATVTGALRGWLSSRGQELRPTTTVRALVPVSVRTESESDPPLAAGGNSSEVTALLIDLPVGEPEPLRRLNQIRYAMSVHQASGRSVGAETLVALSGFAPPTLHSLGARAANGLTERMYDVVVTNVPGPQLPLYAAGARLTEMFPILPLGRGHAVSIGMTSYDGGVCFGINADRDAVADIDVIAAQLTDSLAELLEASPEADAGAEHPGSGSGRGAGRRPAVTRLRRPSARSVRPVRDTGRPQP